MRVPLQRKVLNENDRIAAVHCGNVFTATARFAST